MKPLTAEDLVIGGKYKLHNAEVKYLGHVSIGYAFRGNSGHITYTDDLLNLTPYTEPNQTTMNTDYTEQPFNLETALEHPEWVRTRDGREIDFWKDYGKRDTPFPILALHKDGRFVSYTLDGMLNISNTSPYDLILRVPYREVWVNLFPNGIAYYYNSQDAADKDCNPRRIACVPVKIPAND